MALIDPRRVIVDPLRALVRAAIIKGREALERSAAPPWPEDDYLCGLILRGSLPPLALGDPSATALATLTVSFLEALRPMSAAANLIAAALRLNWNNAAFISVPSVTLPLATFVRQGDPIPVVRGTSAPGPMLEPHKLAVIVSLTGEMLRRSNAEQIIRTVLLENSGPSLDAAMFSTAAAVAETRPAGLLNGLTPLTPSSGGANKTDDAIADLQLLIGAVAPVSGGGQIVLVCAPEQAFSIAARLEDPLYEILPSSAIANGTIIAVATPSLVTIVDAPSIEASGEAMPNESDTPLQISTPGSPNVIAAPTRSYFQTDTVGLRLKLPATWALRSPLGVSYMTGVLW